MAQVSQTQYNTFSAAASVAPIVLWSGAHHGGNVYLAAKNTFLEFYTEEKKAIRRSATARSASCDSSFTAERSSGKSTDAPTTRSASPSDRSLDSHSWGNGIQSPDTTPRTAAFKKTGDRMNQYRNGSYYHNANTDAYPYANDASYVNYDYSHDGVYQADGYPMEAMVMVPMMMPAGTMPCVDDQEQEMYAHRNSRNKRWTQERDNQMMNRNSRIMNKRLNPQADCFQVSHNVMQPQPEVVKPRVISDRMAGKVKQDLSEFNLEPVDEITTLMIRGIPCSFSQDTLMKTFDHAGMKGMYDFFYLPRAGNNGSNLGYAFINFTSQPGAEQFMAIFNGVPLDPSRSTKICTISQADIQGLANLRKHFRRTAVSRGSRGPVFIKVFSGEESE